MKKSEIIFGALRLPIDFLAIAGSFLLAYYLRPITDLIPGIQYHFASELLPDFAEYLKLVGVSSLFLIILLAFNNLYSLKVTHRFVHEFFKIIFLVSIWILCIIAYYALVIHELFFSRIALAHIWIFAIVFLTFGRILIILVQNLLLRFNIGKRRVLFVGANNLADEFYNILKNDPSYKIIGALSDNLKSRKLGCLKIVGSKSDLKRIIKKYKVEEVIQSDPNITEKDSSDLLNFCRSWQINYHFIPDLLKLQRTNVEVSMYENIPLVSLKQSALDGWGYISKRLFDILFSLIFIIILLPVWILMPILIRIDSKGPILYRSNRKYRNKVFGMYKFRSMIPGADKKRNELLEYSERGGPLFKMKNDPRITRFGRFIRKTSLDELPQLFNVLIGHMSLVGPRPHIPEEVEKYKSHHYEVFALKPGISGLAQISGRSNLDFEEEVNLDVFYIENWSLWLDIKFILKSILHVIRATAD